MSLNIEGQVCPVCKGHLFRDDDIVYCPVCGAPHHRECYASVGRCALEEFHGTEQQYEQPENTEKDSHTHQNEGQNEHTVCRYCGEENSKGTLFCEHCGRPLGENPQNTGQPFGGGSAGPFVIDPLGGVQQDEKINGVPAVDFARFVVFNTARYIPLFQRISKQNKTSWNWAAFFFPQGWLFYRKCYKQGILFLMISILASVLMIPTQLFTNTVVPPDAVTTQQVYNAILLKFGEYSLFMQITFALSGLINLGYRIISGLFGDYIYKSNAVSKINLIKSQSNYSELLPHVGGVNIIMLLIAFAASYWIPMAISLLI